MIPYLEAYEQFGGCSSSIVAVYQNFTILAVDYDRGAVLPKQ